MPNRKVIRIDQTETEPEKKPEKTKRLSFYVGLDEFNFDIPDRMTNIELFNLIDNAIQKKEPEKKPVEFTHFVSTLREHIFTPINIPNDYDSVVYLGKNSDGEDLFACSSNGYKDVSIYKGHLNSGEY